MPPGSECPDREEVPTSREGATSGAGSALRADGRAQEQGGAGQREHRDDADTHGYQRPGEQGGDEAFGRSGRRVAAAAEAPAAVEAPATLEASLPPHGEERRHRAEQAEQALSGGPALVDPEQERDEAERDEDDAVHESEDPDPQLGRVGHVLEDHPEQEQRPRHHLREGDPAVEGTRGHAEISYIVSYWSAQCAKRPDGFRGHPDG